VTSSRSCCSAPRTQGLARAHLALGRQQEAAEARRRSGLGPAATDRPPMFTSFSVTARDGMRLSAPSVLSPAPDVRVAQSYDFGDFAFIQTSAGVVAIDAGTSPDRVLAAMADLGLTDHAPVSHLILTHAHFDHIGGTDALRGPDSRSSPRRGSRPRPSGSATGAFPVI
jgi:glyoxylase-like metal-dependent hydrolase (beta-lactamase superfamily II)